jgi:lipid-binding SYLF domain-containing protein
MRLFLTGVFFLSSLTPVFAKGAAQRLEESAAVLSEIMATPDKGIPHDLLDRAHCVVVVPGMKKGAFVVGAQYGKGFLTCRASAGGWSAPAAIKVEGGSVGLQIGGSETDVVMLVMNERAVNKLLSSKFTLGAEGEVAAGPVGRTSSAETDAKMTAEILSWSRSKGLFAGISLKGATLRPDSDENEELYGRKIENREIVMSTKPPAAASRLESVLNQYSPHEKKSE